MNLLQFQIVHHFCYTTLRQKKHDKVTSKLSDPEESFLNAVKNVEVKLKYPKQAKMQATNKRIMSKVYKSRKKNFYYVEFAKLE